MYLGALHLSFLISVSQMFFFSSAALRTIYSIAIERNYFGSSSFGRASTPGQTQTRLEPRVYTFTTPGCCTARIRCWQ